MNTDRALSSDALLKTAYRTLRLEQDYDLAVRQSSIVASDLLRYVQGGVQKSQAVEQALAVNLELYRVYRRLLDASKPRLGKCIASASTQTISERVGEGFVIKWRVSRADSGQVHLILHCDDTDIFNGADAVLHVICGQRVARCNFPPLHDGRTQVVVPTGDILLTLLADCDAELFLR